MGTKKSLQALVHSNHVTDPVMLHMALNKIYEKKTLDADITFIANRICRVCLPSCYGEHIAIGTYSLVSFYQDGALPNKSSHQGHKEVKISWLTCRSHQNPEYNLSNPLPTTPSKGKDIAPCMTLLLTIAFP